MRRNGENTAHSDKRKPLFTRFFFQYKGTLLHFQTIPKWGMRTRKEIFTILVSNTLAKTDL